VHRTDVGATGLPGSCADVVLSSLCLHNLADAGARAAALDEVVRILRPGGTVVVTDLAHVRDEYAPHLERRGLTVRTQRVPATFPPQRLLVARRPG
jgi:arsenite methyltransferase